MFENTELQGRCQKFIDGVFLGLAFVGLGMLYFSLVVIIIILVPIFLYPFSMLIFKINSACNYPILQLCWNPLPMIILWITLFVILPMLGTGILSCINIISVKPTTNVEV